MLSIQKLGIIFLLYCLMTVAAGCRPSGREAPGSQSTPGTNSSGQEAVPRRQQTADHVPNQSTENDETKAVTSTGIVRYSQLDPVSSVATDVVPTTSPGHTSNQALDQKPDRADEIKDELQVKTQELTFDHATKNVRFTGAVRVGQRSFQAIYLQGRIDTSDWSANLIGGDNQTQGVAICLDPEECKEIQLTIYHSEKNQVYSTQLVTHSYPLHSDHSKKKKSESIPSTFPKEPTPPQHNGKKDSVPVSVQAKTPKAPSQTESERSESEEDDGVETQYGGFVVRPPKGLKLPTERSTPLLPLKKWDRGIPQALGRYDHGQLLNATMMPDKGDGFLLLNREQDPNKTDRWGTSLLVNMIQAMAKKLHELFPERPLLAIGSLSSKRGGKHGHQSHQNGLDIDIGYPTKHEVTGDVWPDMVSKKSEFDLERFWAAAKLLAQSNYLIYIIVDPHIKDQVCQYVRKSHDYPTKTDDIRHVALRSFYRQKPVKDSNGHWVTHRSHFHVRLQCPPSSQGCEWAKPVPPKEGTGCK